ncbi:translin isoform X2 [Eurytemora carolleeae]|uniref:translin isoform X2 n=1 Tax=Eurytemora carolleeae TaxID=1294199 RepID=UPI000C77B05C|nr:translin isoform X2 [Eurytemora carolleeae]|eukprot:XP_023330510.1 translin-like isoform X2 [Eurytemora affinis]
MNMEETDEIGVFEVFSEYGNYLVKVSALLGMDTGLTSLHLDIEEYLLGLCNLCNELSRLAVNSVTSEDYSRPVRIAEFLNSLHTGFRLLNLKNDNLRKRFDSIKYDLKKVEEVVYDLSIRGLSKVSLEDKAEEKTAAPSGPTEAVEAAPVAAV